MSRGQNPLQGLDIRDGEPDVSSMGLGCTDGALGLTDPGEVGAIHADVDRALRRNCERSGARYSRSHGHVQLEGF